MINLNKINIEEKRIKKYESTRNKNEEKRKQSRHESNPRPSGRQRKFQPLGQEQLVGSWMHP